MSALLVCSMIMVGHFVCCFEFFDDDSNAAHCLFCFQVTDVLSWPLLIATPSRQKRGRERKMRREIRRNPRRAKRKRRVDFFIYLVDIMIVPWIIVNLVHGGKRNLHSFLKISLFFENVILHSFYFTDSRHHFSGWQHPLLRPLHLFHILFCLI
jgi:hypothetical protein